MLTFVGVFLISFLWLFDSSRFLYRCGISPALGREFHPVSGLNLAKCRMGCFRVAMFSGDGKSVAKYDEQVTLEIYNCCVGGFNQRMESRITMERIVRKHGRNGTITASLGENDLQGTWKYLS